MKNNFHGNRLKWLRFQYDLSMGQLADKLEISKQSISKYESESMQPKAVIIAGICAIFNVEIWFFTNEEINVTMKGKKIDIIGINTEPDQREKRCGELFYEHIYRSKLDGYKIHSKCLRCGEENN
jgi:transcriptional regulator with XRE-family HTH domain